MEREAAREGRPGVWSEVTATGGILTREEWNLRFVNWLARENLTLGDVRVVIERLYGPGHPFFSLPLKWKRRVAQELCRQLLLREALIDLAPEGK